MNKQQLHITIKYLREVSEDLISAASEKETIDKDIMILQANEELLHVIRTLLDHYNEIGEES